MPASPRQQPVPKVPKPGATKALQKKIESGLVSVPIGPFGLFGERVMTVAEFQRRAQRRQPAAKKPASRKATQRRWLLWPIIYVETKPKKKAASSKKKRWIIPGILYW